MMLKKRGALMRQITSVLGLLNLSVFLKSHLFLLPVLYLFYTSCGITLADFFLIQGLSSLTCLLLDVPMGYVADRVSKKKILILSNLVLVLRFLLLYFFPTKPIIFLGEILTTRMIIGCTLIFSAIILSEVNFKTFFRQRN